MICAFTAYFRNHAQLCYIKHKSISPTATCTLPLSVAFDHSEICFLPSTDLWRSNWLPCLNWRTINFRDLRYVIFNQSINQSIEFCNLRANLLGLAGQWDLPTRFRLLKSCCQRIYKQFSFLCMSCYFQVLPNSMGSLSFFLVLRTNARGTKMTTRVTVGGRETGETLVPVASFPSLNLKKKRLLAV